MATTEDMKFHTTSKAFKEPFSNKGKDLVVQFQVAANMISTTCISAPVPHVQSFQYDVG